MNNTIYRVENKFGQGMYTGPRPLNYCDEYQAYRYPEDDTFDNERHPMPSETLMSLSNKGFLFAFESLSALKRWLFEESWGNYLDENGYQICEYTVYEMYKEDSRQCVFNPDKAELVSITTFSELKSVLKS